MAISYHQMKPCWGLQLAPGQPTPFTMQTLTATTRPVEHQPWWRQPAKPQVRPIIRRFLLTFGPDDNTMILPPEGLTFHLFLCHRPDCWVSTIGIRGRVEWGRRVIEDQCCEDSITIQPGARTDLFMYDFIPRPDDATLCGLLQAIPDPNAMLQLYDYLLENQVIPF